MVKKTKIRTRNKKSENPNQIDTGDQAVRINKYIADAGICSRRKADELIHHGEVTINDNLVIEPGTKVLPGDIVKVKGNIVASNRHYEYILLNKPKDYITTTNDEKGRKTVLDLVRKKVRLFPVGRLDRNTTGVLLLTNDGELAYRLTHPKYQIERVYNVALDKKLNSNDAKKIAEGITIEGESYSPCSILIDPKDSHKVTVILTEGKNRELHKVFAELGYSILRLNRIMYANLTTRGLRRGEYRHLTKKELSELKKLVKL